MQTDAGTKMRGTIVKVPGSTPGLIVANGQQKTFLLENVWLSAVAPTPNMTVELTSDSSGIITGITVVDAQQLAKEKFQQFSGVAQVHGKEAAGTAAAGVLSVVGRLGKTTLTLTILLWVVWFFVPAVTFDTPMFSKSFTFWTMLGIDFRTTLISHGFFSFLALCGIVGPLAIPFIATPRARWLCAAPLVATVVGIISVGSEVHKLFAEVEDFAGRAATHEMGQLFSLRPGGYLVIIIGLFLATRAIRLRSNTRVE